MSRRSSTDVEIVVIGNGPFGAAVTRQLADAGRAVLSIGSPRYDHDDPVGEGDPDRVYSSHNDAARLTRRAFRDPRWAEIQQRAIDRYAEIEERSGIRFHEPVGVLLVGGKNPAAMSFEELRSSLRSHGIDHEAFPVGDRSWRDRWPDLDFPTDEWVIYEPDPAGYIRPLDLIAAQNAIAADNGAAFITGVATRVERVSERWRVHLGDGSHHDAPLVVVAGGAFSDLHDLVPGGIDLELKSEVVLLGTLSDHDGERLAQVPTVHWYNEPTAVDDIYMVGPVRYPDGRYKIKLGANTSLDTWFGSNPSSLTAVQEWFATSTDADYLPLFEPYLRALWPGVEFEALETHPCIITYRPDRVPLIAEVDEGLVVATAGNGSGAKSADGWAERATALVQASLG